MQPTMTVRETARDKAEARKWWDSLSSRDRWELGDQLVQGEFDWRDWLFNSRPSRAFMNEVDYQRMLWEDSDHG